MNSNPPCALCLGGAKLRSSNLSIGDDLKCGKGKGNIVASRIFDFFLAKAQRRKEIRWDLTFQPSTTHHPPPTSHLPRPEALGFRERDTNHHPVLSSHPPLVILLPFPFTLHRLPLPLDPCPSISPLPGDTEIHQKTHLAGKFYRNLDTILQ